MSSNASHRYPVIALVTLAVLLLAVAAAHSAEAPNPEPLTLRLVDLPKGWKVGDDTGCGPLGTEDATADVVDLVLRYHPSGCVREFNKLWGAAKPFYVQSVALTFGDGGADQALAAAPGLMRYFGLDGAPPSPVAAGIGDRSQVYVQPKGYPPGPQPSPETAVVWRRGDVVAFVVAG